MTIAAVLTMMALLGCNEDHEKMNPDPSKNDTLSVHGFRGPSLSQVPVDVKMGQAHLRIPRNYLVTALLSKSYDSGPGCTLAASLTIVTTFPEFTGATDQTIHCYQPLSACLNKTVTLYTLGESQADINERRVPAVTAAAQIASINQLELVKVDVRISPVPDDIFVAYGGTVDNSIVVECSRDPIEMPTTDCRVYLKFEGVPMLYQFHRILLPNWHAIHEGINRMLSSFYVGRVN